MLVELGCSLLQNILVNILKAFLHHTINNWLPFSLWLCISLTSQFKINTDKTNTFEDAKLYIRERNVQVRELFLQVWQTPAMFYLGVIINSRNIQSTRIALTNTGWHGKLLRFVAAETQTNKPFGRPSWIIWAFHFLTTAPHFPVLLFWPILVDMASGGLQEGSLSGRQSEKSPVTAAKWELSNPEGNPIPRPRCSWVQESEQEERPEGSKMVRGIEGHWAKRKANVHSGATLH